MKQILTAGGALAILAFSSVTAAGPYVGVGLGGARAEADLREIGLMPSIAEDAADINPDFSSTDVGFQFIAGYRFLTWFGVEVGYADLGKARQNYELAQACTSPGGCQNREWTAEYKTDLLQAYLTGYYPLGERVDVYAKIGAVRWDTDFSGFEQRGQFENLLGGDPVTPTPNDTINTDDDGTDLAAALGLDLKTDSAISLRTEFAWYDIDNRDQSWLLSLNAIYNF